MEVRYEPDYGNGQSTEIAVGLTNREIQGVVDRTGIPSGDIMVPSELNSNGLLTKISVFRTRDPELIQPFTAMVSKIPREFARMRNGSRRKIMRPELLNPGTHCYFLNVTFPMSWGCQEIGMYRSHIPLKSKNQITRAKKTNVFKPFVGHYVFLRAN